MVDEERAAGASPSFRLLVVALLAWSVLAFALPLSALTLNGVKIAAYPMGYWLTAFGCPLLLALLALWFQKRVGGDGGGQAIGSSLSISAEALGAAGVLGFAAAIVALGFDGLAYSLGLVAGLALLSILVAPRLAQYPAYSVTNFLEMRFGSVWPSRIALFAIAISSVFLLAANLRGAALITQGLMASDYGTSLAGAATALTLFWLSRSMLQVRGPVGVTLIMAFAGLLIFLIGQFWHHGRSVLPDLLAGQYLTDLFAIDQKLIASKLADFTSLRPMTSPFSRLSATNFLGIALAFALGVAVLPSFLWQNRTPGTSGLEHASRVASRAAVGVALVLIFLPIIAAQLRLGVETIIATGIKSAAIPDSIRQSAGLGWISVCGAYTEIEAACAKASGHRGTLRLQEIGFDGDAALLAGPLIANITSLVWVLPLWIAALVVSIVSGYALLNSFINVTRPPNRTSPGDESHLQLRSIALAISLILGSVLIAMLGRLSIAQFAAQGFALLASALFPALLLGLYWRRMTAAGAMTAMIIGSAVSLFYIAGSSLFPIQFFDWTGALSNASVPQVRRFADLQAAYAGAADGDARSAAYTVLLQHGIPLANWFGLEKPSIVLVAVPAGFVSGLIASLLAKRSPGGS